MATIYDLLEVTSITANTSYSLANGNLLGVVDGAVSPQLDDGEFDQGDLISIGGVSYRIDLIQEPSSSGSFLLGDGSTLGFAPQSESNLDVMFLTLSNGGITRYFILPNDSFGDANIQGITTGGITDVAGNDAAVIGTVDNTTEVVCFASGTLIEVQGGHRVPVETLGRGDLVRTADHGLQPLKWVGMRQLDPSALASSPRLRPIRIKAGTLGIDKPFQDLVVSPQHRVLIRSKVADRMFGTPEVLVPARMLLSLKGIEIAEDLESVTYCHLLFERHEVIVANGLMAESLLTGPQALKALGAEARGEIFEIFPELAKGTPETMTARALAVGHRARRLLFRHAKNGVALQTPA